MSRKSPRTARTDLRWFVAISVLLTGNVLKSPVSYAGPNAGGTLIVSYECTPSATCSTQDWGGSLSTCEDAVVQAPPATSFPCPPEQRALWYVYAAFPSGSNPRLTGIQFGINYNPFTGGHGLQVLSALAPPTAVGLPEAGWPGPGSGVMLAWSPGVQTSNLTAIFAFTGYGSAGETFKIVDHPRGRAMFADDSLPPNLDLVAGFGSLGFGVDGARACSPGPAQGACCLSTVQCRILSPEGCAAAGGQYIGDWINCSSTLCLPEGACCYTEGQCVISWERECLTGDWRLHEACEPNPCEIPVVLGSCCAEDGSCTYAHLPNCASGFWRAGQTCDPNPCTPAGPGACCFSSDLHCEFVFQGQCLGDFWMPAESCSPNPCWQQLNGACCLPSGLCVMVSRDHCVASGGEWEGGLCDLSLCQPTPVETGSWGRIKCRFR